MHQPGVQRVFDGREGDAPLFRRKAFQDRAVRRIPQGVEKLGVIFRVRHAGKVEMGVTV